MPTRPSAHPYASSSTSSRIVRPSNPIHRLYPLFSGLTFHVITAKLETEVGRIYECIDDLGGRCVGVEECKIVVSAIKGRARLLRSLGKEWIDIKPIVTTGYIFDTYQLCLESASASNVESVPHLPPRSKYQVTFPIPSPVSNPSFPFPPKVPRLISSDEENDVKKPVLKRTRVSGGDGDGRNGTRGVKKQEIVEEGLVGGQNGDDKRGIKTEEWVEEGDMTLFDEDVRFEDIPALCCLRGSPLVCVNQDIVTAIKPIFQEREYEEAQQKNSNVLSYRRSLSVTVPRRLKSGKEAMKLLGVGDKVAQRIDEFLQSGYVAESEAILASSRFQALELFASVYTIGHHKAKDLYDRHYCRTLEDVRLHFEAVEEESPEVRMKDRLRRRKRGGMKQVEIVEEWIALKDELDAKIPREEVQEIADCVMEHLDVFIPGCEYTICGGYRRGKPQSNDVDVVFAPPKQDQDIGLLKDLYLRLSDLGIITHVLHVTHREEDVPIHASPQNFDNLDKAFVIFKLPGKGRLHRRVDLISAPRDRYASAVLSWSGSMMFERDLKRYAENERGYKFRAGLIKITTGEEFNLKTERDIFSFLGLRYVPPELRNADG
ncbi:hypothetical protein IAR55_001828 [Kwoniella newhampshirensis]|uniref:DNA polymerase n=1 Tax=Kwoniella newhampshirensis TaxID=1651941 RepID=A0AAW0Z368_9TREE